MIEYKSIPFKNGELDALINEAGREGWDLVQVSYVEKVAILKRSSPTVTLQAPPKPSWTDRIASALSRLKGKRTIGLALAGLAYVAARLTGAMPPDLMSPEKQVLIDKLIGFSALLFAALKGRRIEEKLKG